MTIWGVALGVVAWLAACAGARPEPSAAVSRVAAHDDTAAAPAASRPPQAAPAPALIALGRFALRLDGFVVEDEPRGAAASIVPRPEGKALVVREITVDLAGPEASAWRCVVEEEVVRDTPGARGQLVSNEHGLAVGIALDGGDTESEAAGWSDPVGTIWLTDREGLLVSVTVNRLSELRGPSRDEAVLRAIAVALDEREPLDLGGGAATFDTAMGRLTLDLPPGMIIVEHFSDEHGTTSWDLTVVREGGSPWQGIALGWVGSAPDDSELRRARRGRALPVAGVSMRFFEELADRLRGYTDPPEYTFVIAAPRGPARDALAAILAAGRLD